MFSKLSDKYQFMIKNIQSLTGPRTNNISCLWQKEHNLNLSQRTSYSTPSNHWSKLFLSHRGELGISTASTPDKTQGDGQLSEYQDWSSQHGWRNSGRTNWKDGFKVEIKEEPLMDYCPGVDPQMQELLANNNFLWVKLEQQHQTYCNNCGMSYKEYQRRTIITRRYNPRYTHHQKICEQKL